MIDFNEWEWTPEFYESLVKVGFKDSDIEEASRDELKGAYAEFLKALGLKPDQVKRLVEIELPPGCDPSYTLGMHRTAWECQLVREMKMGDQLFRKPSKAPAGKGKPGKK